MQIFRLGLNYMLDHSKETIGRGSPLFYIGGIDMTFYFIGAGAPNICKVEAEESDILQTAYDLIGCRFVEVVSFRAGFFDLALLVDEEGFLRSDPQTNKLASVLAGKSLVGGALAVCIRGEDIVGLSDLDQDEIKRVADMFSAEIRADIKR